MPGVSLLYNATNQVDSFEESLNSVSYFENYKEHIIVDDYPINIGYTGYESYPTELYQNKDFTILLEGHIYNSSNTRETVEVAAEKIANNERLWVQNWLLNLDSEFILVVLENSTDNVYILNDPLARLPIFTHIEGDSISVSRELGFILDSHDIHPDSLGIAQQLLFGYPLGERTLFKNVHQLPPASLVQIKDGELTIDSLHEFNVENKTHSDKSIDENATELTDRITAACRHRDLGSTNVLSLSGGMDSRVLAASLSDAEIPYIAATYNRGNATTTREAQTAQEIMDILGEDWYEYHINNHGNKHQEILLKTKRGMNTVGMSFILEFFEDLQSDFGEDIIYLTGDGGAKLTSWTPPRQFSSNEEIVEYLIADQSQFSLEEVVNLSIHSEEEIRRSIHKRLRSFPEEDPSQRYIHFLIRERSFKWGIHGEDRNRYYFWSTAPLYSYPIFKYGMNVPDRQKKYNKLYRSVLSEYSSNLSKVDYIDFGAPVGSTEYKIKNFVYRFAKARPTLGRRIIQQFNNTPQMEEEIVELLKEKYEDSNTLPDIISEPAIQEYVEGSRTATSQAGRYLLTSVLSIYLQETK